MPIIRQRNFLAVDCAVIKLIPTIGYPAFCFYAAMNRTDRDYTSNAELGFTMDDAENSIAVLERAGLITVRKEYDAENKLIATDISICDTGFLSGKPAQPKKIQFELTDDKICEPIKSASYAAYLQTPHWKEISAAACKRAKYRCQLCNAADAILNAHHRTYVRIGCEEPEDLTVLCTACHRIFHNYRVVKDGE